MTIDPVSTRPSLFLAPLPTPQERTDALFPPDTESARDNARDAVPVALRIDRADIRARLAAALWFAEQDGDLAPLRSLLAAVGAA